MAGMPKQGYKNLVLAGWVPDPALGLGGTGHTGALPCPPVAPGVGWVLLAGGPGDTPPATAGMEGEGEGVGGKKNQKGRRKGKACLTQRRNLIRAELYSPAKDIGYFRDIGKK